MSWGAVAVAAIGAGGSYLASKGKGKGESISGYSEPATSATARRDIAEIAKTSAEGIPLQQIADFSPEEQAAIDMAMEFMRDNTGNVTIDAAIDLATQLAAQKVDMNSPEVQGIIQEVRKTGDLAINRIGRGLQKQGTLSTTAGRDILARSVSETEKATAASLSPLFQSMRSQNLQATGLLSSLTGQKAGLTQSRIGVGGAAGAMVTDLQQRINNALQNRRQQQFEFETTGKASIANLLLQKPLPYVSEGGPSGLSKALSTGRDIAGAVSVIGGLASGGAAGGLAAMSATGGGGGQTAGSAGGKIKLPSQN